jgi:tetratricopeptide (TPR) repeat protein
MQNRISRSVLLCLIFGAWVSCSIAEADQRPLTKSELLALVAAEVLPENIASEIRLDGLDFIPDEGYSSLLKVAGADPRIFQALATAAQKKGAASDNPADRPSLTRLASAGKIIRAGELDSAASELNESPTVDSSNPAVAFVMGAILIKQQRWEDASQVYSEILRLQPDFPEVHTRLSLTFYNSGDPEEAISVTARPPLRTIRKILQPI